jgi:hypothetical protein
MRKCEYANWPLSEIPLGHNYHDRYSAVESRVGIYRVHLHEVIPTWLYGPRRVVVPLSDVVGAEFAPPSFGKQPTQTSYASMEPASTPG